MSDADRTLTEDPARDDRRDEPDDTPAENTPTGDTPDEVRSDDPVDDVATDDDLDEADRGASLPVDPPVDPPTDDDAGVVDADIAIRVDDLHITYRSVVDKKQTMRAIVGNLGRRRRDKPDNQRLVRAVRGVTFDVRRGEVMGIIGHNGAGKSTMLRGIAGILPPNQGRIEVAGQVSTLLALGVGFNTKLTGRQNILVGGLAAGMGRHEIEQREEEIIDFSGVRDFIDMPMRTYSSGMRGRLAFAVSTSLDPDILLIDEALSAGDADFREKAADRMRKLLGEGRTIMLVSHSMSSVRDLSDRVLWLANGQVVRIGQPDDVIDDYEATRDAGRGRVKSRDDSSGRNGKRRRPKS